MWADPLRTCCGTGHVLPCLEPAVLAAVPPPGDSELPAAGTMAPLSPHLPWPTRHRPAVSGWFRTALLSVRSLTGAVMSYPLSSLPFHSRGSEGTVEEDRVFVTTKHLFMACGHGPMCPSPRPGGQCVPGLFEFRPDSSGDDKEVFGVFGTSFCCCKIPLVHAAHQPTSRALDCGAAAGMGRPERWRQLRGRRHRQDAAVGCPRAWGTMGTAASRGQNLMLCTLSLPALLLVELFGAGLLLSTGVNFL